MNRWIKLTDRTRYEDNKGEVIDPEKLDELPAWEIEERGIHVAQEDN
jgi:hypothetical protein